MGKDRTSAQYDNTDKFSYHWFHRSSMATTSLDSCDHRASSPKTPSDDHFSDVLQGTHSQQTQSHHCTTKSSDQTCIKIRRSYVAPQPSPAKTNGYIRRWL
ncbi:hypothetical protein EJ06DRAFT_61545 [Trichodelitschia bisporula]|uniref:Uncharacterized protein n=1 Tax=Trichodelitschia bisporula TaxID=703511 RepID=A0A6G1HUI4_9PEZI|nr:hypothetical protein EJ06DRAFT_61545 [Trichodelitschia bisporula]